LVQAELTLTEPPTVWAVVKASALRRIGRPLLVWYVVLLGIGVVVVLTSLLVMRFG
jgi:hypothetical protein